jgi:hypothetical protein
MQAEVFSVLYELSASAYERIKRENPGLSHALLTYIVTVMAERLSFANRAIGVLQRWARSPMHLASDRKIEPPSRWSRKQMPARSLSALVETWLV